MDTLFVWTPAYARKADSLVTDAEQRAIETEIAIDPERFPIIRGTGGVRKMRARVGGRGKRSGVRVCYYWVADPKNVFLLTMYGKGEKADLTAADRKAVRAMVEAIESDLAEWRAR